MVGPGDTFFIHVPNARRDPIHYFVLTSLEVSTDGTLLCVYLKPLRLGSDTSCVIRPNEYPGVTEDHIVEYGRPFLADSYALTEALENNPDVTWNSHKCSPELLRKMQEGALTSDHISPRYRKLVEAELNRRNK